MKLIARRTFVATMLGMAIAAAFPASAADNWPAKPLTIIVPHSPGGTSDILARTIAGRISKTLGQPVIVENKAGANGTIAAKQVASAPADGYTLLLATASTHGINPSLYKKVPYNAIKDFAPVTLLATVPNVLVVSKTMPAKSVSELIKVIKDRGDTANMGSAGSGTPGHLAGEMFRESAKLKFTHIPYKGGAPAITDLIGGQIDFMFTTVPGVISHIKSGTLRPLAVTSPRRTSALAQTPTMDESGLPGFQAVSWHGIMAPAGTSEDIIAKLAKVTREALASPEVKERLAQEGAEASGLSQAEFGKFVASELASWGKAVKLSGASAD